MTSTTISTTTTTLTTTQTTPPPRSPDGGSSQFAPLRQLWRCISSTLSSSDHAKRIGKSDFEHKFCMQQGLLMLIPFCGNSLVFRFQSVSKTLRTSCHRVLEDKGIPLHRLDATFAELNAKVAALVNAVATRGLTPAELARVGLPPHQFSNAMDQTGYVSRLKEAERAETEFLDVYKERCALLGVNMRDGTLLKYSFSVMQLLDQRMLLKDQTSMARLSRSAPQLSRIKMDGVKDKIGRLIYTDMVEAYAQLPIAQITPDSYRAKVAEIKAVFNENSRVDIEASLRQALKMHHKESFNQEADAYLDSKVSNAKVAAIKASLAQKLTAEKEALEGELASLRGPTGLSGTIHAAMQNQDAALLALETAKKEFIALFAAAFGPLGSLTVDQMLGLDFRTCPESLQEAQATLKLKHTRFQAANAEFQRLNARFSELAKFTWNPATLTLDITAAGKVLEIRQKLVAANLESLARAEATKIGNFYRELLNDVTDANKQARYDALHAVIDAP